MSAVGSCPASVHGTRSSASDTQMSSDKMCAAIRTWITGSTKPDQDLHVSDLGVLSSGIGLVQDSLDAFSVALNIARSLGREVRVSIDFPLRAGPRPQGLNFSSIEELAGELSGQPPSLRVVPPDWKYDPVTLMSEGWVYDMFETRASDLEIRFSECESYGEFFRFLWLVEKA